MEKITINNKVYNIPTSWEEMNFEQFLKLSDYLKNVADQEDYPDEIFYSNLVRILTGSTDHSYGAINFKDIEKFKAAIKFISTKFNNATYSNTLEHNGLIIRIKNFETLTFGEYTELMHLSNIKSQYELIKLISFMCDISQKRDIKRLRFRETKLNFTNAEKEQIIKALPATKANAVSSFFAWSKTVASQYGVLFASSGNASNHESNFTNGWSYYIWIMDACDEDITKLDYVVDISFRQVLTYLAYKTSKNNMITAVRKEEEQKSKYKR